MDDPSAFPGSGGGCYWNGMSLRDYFAVRAMQALIEKGFTREFTVEESYRFADLMLLERAKPAKDQAGVP